MLANINAVVTLGTCRCWVAENPSKPAHNTLLCCRELIKDQLIPRAVAWYTGAAVQELADEDEDEDEDDDEDDDDEDDDDEEDEVRCP